MCIRDRSVTVTAQSGGGQEEVLSTCETGQTDGRCIDNNEIKQSWFGRLIEFIKSLFGFGADNQSVQDNQPEPPVTALPEPGNNQPTVTAPPSEEGAVTGNDQPSATNPNQTEVAGGEVTIIYRDGKYDPRLVDITIGQTVTWINEDQVFWPATDLHPTHTIYPETNIIKCNQPEERAVMFDACEPMPSGSEYSFTFNEPGEWGFHDHINPAAKGTVTVTP